MLVLYGLIASGLPLPLGGPAADSPQAQRLAAKDRSRPFPCMDKPCGCRSATQCFTNCCCHSPAETLAWAKARRLEPAVLAALERRVASAAPPSSGCCSSGRAADCADASCDAESPDEAICSDYQSLAADPVEPAITIPSPPEAPVDHEPRVGNEVVILQAMLACGGIVGQWMAVAVSLPPPQLAAWDLPWPLVDTLSHDDERALGLAGPPDAPPPRA
ncbi:MAG: hypothetical protein RLZZ440_1222 [Planctomycetota bacterium]|jgi:hypothetical protein